MGLGYTASQQLWLQHACTRITNLPGTRDISGGGSAGTNLHEACMLPSCEKTQVRLATSA